LWWTADPPRPFRLRPVPICSALRFLVAGLLPAFIYRRLRVYLKEPRIPFESPLWYDRFSWQNPVRVTRPVPPGRCPFSSTLFAFRRVGLQANSHSVRFRSCDLLRPSVRFRSRDLLLPSVRFRPRGLLRSSCDPSLSVGGLLSNGGLKLLLKDWIVKAPKAPFRMFISSRISVKNYKSLNR
jgi:hypothetical protein